MDIETRCVCVHFIIDYYYYYYLPDKETEMVVLFVVPCGVWKSLTIFLLVVMLFLFL